MATGWIIAISVLGGIAIGAGLACWYFLSNLGDWLDELLH